MSHLWFIPCISCDLNEHTFPLKTVSVQGGILSATDICGCSPALTYQLYSHKLTKNSPPKIFGVSIFNIFNDLNYQLLSNDLALYHCFMSRFKFRVSSNKKLCFEQEQVWPHMPTSTRINLVHVQIVYKDIRRQTPWNIFSD